jgi:hypothetical protein
MKAYQVSYRTCRSVGIGKMGEGGMQTHMVDGNVLDEMDAYHSSISPSFDVFRYMRMKAYGNYYRVVGETNVNTMATYDCGMASVFQQAQGPGGVCALGPM